MPAAGAPEALVGGGACVGPKAAARRAAAGAADGAWRSPGKSTRTGAVAPPHVYHQNPTRTVTMSGGTARQLSSRAGPGLRPGATGCGAAWQARTGPATADSARRALRAPAGASSESSVRTRTSRPPPPPWRLSVPHADGAIVIARVRAGPSGGP